MKKISYVNKNVLADAMENYNNEKMLAQSMGETTFTIDVNELAVRSYEGRYGLNSALFNVRAIVKLTDMYLRAFVKIAKSEFKAREITRGEVKDGNGSYALATFTL